MGKPRRAQVFSFSIVVFCVRLLRSVFKVMVVRCGLVKAQADRCVGVNIRSTMHNT